MYEKIEPKKPFITVIHVDSVKLKCSGFPTIFEFTDTEGTEYYFRLSGYHGIIVCKETDEWLADGDMDEDDMCDWDDVVKWAMMECVLLKTDGFIAVDRSYE